MSPKFKVGDIVANISLHHRRRTYLYKIVALTKTDYMFEFLTEPDPVGTTADWEFRLMEDRCKKLTKLDRALN